jgi:hypothetical protein
MYVRRSTDPTRSHSIQFTPPDLAEIAHELDQLEQNYDEGSRQGRSTNMDDTGAMWLGGWLWRLTDQGRIGYFSVQVLENALKNAFGLT